MGKPQRKTKLTTKAKALRDGMGSEDELAGGSSDGGDMDEKVEFYTRDSKSPFTKLNLIVIESPASSTGSTLTADRENTRNPNSKPF